MNNAAKLAAKWLDAALVWLREDHEVAAEIHYVGGLTRWMCDVAFQVALDAGELETDKDWRIATREIRRAYLSSAWQSSAKQICREAADAAWV